MYRLLISFSFGLIRIMFEWLNRAALDTHFLTLTCLKETMLSFYHTHTVEQTRFVVLRGMLYQ